MSDAPPKSESGPSSEALELIIGGKYRIESLLGEGGFARVYRARHARIRNLEYAIKVLKQRQLGAAEAVDRFVREAEMSAALQSPYIVRLMDFGETTAGLPYIVMEFVYGVTVHDYIKKHGRMRAIEVARVVTCVLRALEEAHSKGIIHRDLKPSNIMLLIEPTDDVIAKVTDFGIAKVMDDSSTGLEPSPQTTGGVVFCTPQYAGPEVLMGEPNLQSDLYALGHTMAEMLDGVGPFAGMGGFEVAGLQMKPEITRFGALTRASELYPIIARACAKDLKQRYLTATEMLADLDRVVEQLKRRSVSVMRPMAGQKLSARTGSSKGLREGVLADFGAGVLAGDPNAGTRPIYPQSPPPVLAAPGDDAPISSGQIMIVEVERSSDLTDRRNDRNTVAAGVHANQVRHEPGSDVIPSVVIDPGVVPARPPVSRDSAKVAALHSPRAVGEPSVSFSGTGSALEEPRLSQMRMVLTPISGTATLPPGAIPRDGGDAQKAMRLAMISMFVAVSVAVGAAVFVATRPAPEPERIYVQVEAPPVMPVTPPTPTITPTQPPPAAVPVVEPAQVARAIYAAQLRVFAAVASAPAGPREPADAGDEDLALALAIVTPELARIVPYPVNVDQVARPAYRRTDAAPSVSTPTAPAQPKADDELPPGSAPRVASRAATRAWEPIPDPVPDRVVTTPAPSEGSGNLEQRRRTGMRINQRQLE